MSTNVSILTSPDGAAFTVEANPWDTIPATGKGVAWNGTTAAAVGETFGTGDVIETSTDGVSWTGRSSGLDSYGRGTCVCWGASAGLFVAGGTTRGASTTDPLIVTSPTGTTWTTRLSAPGLGAASCGIDAVVAMGSIVVAGGVNVMDDAGNYQALAYSTDGGLTWSVVPHTNHPFHGTGSFTGGSVTGLATDGTTILAVGQTDPGTYIVATSTNGLNWTAGGALPTGFQPFTAAFGNSIWVLGGSSAKSIATSSSPGSGYTTVTSPFDNQTVHGIAYSSDLSQWIAVGYEGATQTIATASSPSGTWTNRTTPADDASAEFFGAVWAHSLTLWIVVGAGLTSGGWAVGHIGFGGKW